MDDERQNPIVAMATKIRARRDLGLAIDSAMLGTPAADANDAEASFAALADALATGSKRLNSILGKNGVTFIRIEKPLRIRLRFNGKRVALDLDRDRQLVIIAGIGLDGEYQFIGGEGPPSLINLSVLSTAEGYGDAITASSLLKSLSQDAELPRPAHLDASGPLSL